MDQESDMIPSGGANAAAGGGEHDAGEAGKFGGASDIKIRIFEVKMNGHEELLEDF